MLYAIGDIHGQLAQLDRALALIEADGGRDAPHVFLGDLPDRGPDTRGVIDRLMAGQAEGRDWTVLFSNHDRMFLRFVRDGVEQDAAIKSGKGWLHPALGGPATLASYDVHADDEDPDRAELLAEVRAAVPQAHLDWIAARPRWHRAQGHLFVHAGLRPGIPVEDQSEEDLIWIRDGWLDDTRDHGEMVVHGHTALDHPRHEGNRINMDGGAGYGRPLVPAVLEDGQWFLLSGSGRQPLTPPD
ncbi:MAG: metallophosphoesterase [Salibaculum sp.]|uniref:metallophosphoesterase n=1 Tax=Salibaculum sp. TaxID=2855480 RepID=UPI00286FE75D|nr:metallophosphoesterase [Salibaculum sp.]MDR9428300.1 metallophosphoesterase [Salibaculum sp.]MDR9482637.1 metallophosphoesterase [Salibaculum sp.]